MSGVILSIILTNPKDVWSFKGGTRIYSSRLAIKLATFGCQFSESTEEKKLRVPIPAIC